MTLGGSGFFLRPKTSILLIAKHGEFVLFEVAFKRPITTLLTEYNQRCHARFTIDDFEEATELTVSVVRRIAEQLHRELAGTKHVSEGFAVLAIDDHGDVDGFAVT